MRKMIIFFNSHVYAQPLHREVIQDTKAVKYISN